MFSFPKTSKSIDKIDLVNFITDKVQKFAILKVNLLEKNLTMENVTK